MGYPGEVTIPDFVVSLLNTISQVEAGTERKFHINKILLHSFTNSYLILKKFINASQLM